MTGVELWKPVRGFEKRYAISNLGRIKNLNKYSSHNGQHWPERLMTIQLDYANYCTIKLRKPNVYKKFRIHCLVAIHFIEKIEGKDYVNHKDKNRSNNTVDNLEWMTHQENIAHRDADRQAIADNDEPF